MNHGRKKIELAACHKEKKMSGLSASMNRFLRAEHYRRTHHVRI
jgi:hypothetical protein